MTITRTGASITYNDNTIITDARTTMRGIFAYGGVGTSNQSMSNLISNTGAVSTDITGVGTARRTVAATSYGNDRAMFAWGLTNNDWSNGSTNISNLVSNAGVIATDQSGIGTARGFLGGAGYGLNKGIFAYGYNASAYQSMSNLVSSAGVLASDTAGVGTARYGPGAATYGVDKAIFGYGYSNGGRESKTNLVSNTGVVATDTTGVGTTRYELAAAGYGGDKAIFGYGYTTTYVSISNLVSNTGVVATDTTGVGTARAYLAGTSFNFI